jgi:hypothetical protein
MAMDGVERVVAAGDVGTNSVHLLVARVLTRRLSMEPRNVQRHTVLLGTVRSMSRGEDRTRRSIREVTMRYLFLLNRTEDELPEPGTPEAMELFEAYRVANEAMAAAGVLRDCAPLPPLSSSTTVRVRDGETLITDGPAAEIKEHLGGYSIVECADLDEALKWAVTMPAAASASVEVRPIIDPEVRS